MMIRKVNSSITVKIDYDRLQLILYFRKMEEDPIEKIMSVLLRYGMSSDEKELLLGYNDIYIYIYIYTYIYIYIIIHIYIR